MVMKRKASQELMKVKFLNKNSNNMQEVCDYVISPFILDWKYDLSLRCFLEPQRHHQTLS